jgi:hypothetical protein
MSKTGQSGDRPDRELLVELLERVRTARKAYYTASAEHARVIAEFGDLLDHPDNTSALVRAARYETQTIVEYRRALTALSQFLSRR